MNAIYYDCKCVVIHDAYIGVPAGEGMKVSELASHGASRGPPVVGTPDKVGLCMLPLQISCSSGHVI
jgi:hypothetical protein